MRRAGDEIDLAVAQRRDRRDRPERPARASRSNPSALKEAEFAPPPPPENRNSRSDRAARFSSGKSSSVTIVIARARWLSIIEERKQELPRARRIGGDRARARRDCAAASPASRASSRCLLAIDCSCTNSTRRPCGAADRRDRGAAPVLAAAHHRASLSARLAASWSPPLRPMPPIGLLTCAASPASSTRPSRKRRRDALMRHIEIAMDDLVGLRARERISAAAPARPHRSAARLRAARRIGRKDRAPQARRTVGRDLEAIAPFLGIGEIAARAIAPLGLEIERRRQHDEALGPGEALELDAACLRTTLRPPSAPMR